MNTKLFSPRLGGTAGIIGAIEFSITWLGAALADRNWVLGEMTLSELGGSGRPGSLLFNTGVVVQAFMAMVFVMGLYKALSKTRLALAGTSALFLSAVALLGVGLFNISAGAIHAYFSYAFFLLAGLGLVLLVAPMWSSHVFHSSGGAATLLAVVIPILLLPAIRLAAVEAVAVIVLILWVLFASIRMMAHHPAR